MAVKTIWPIEFACGHTEERDLSNKRADGRAGLARYLASTVCTPCWRAQQDAATNKAPSAEWVAQKRAEETAEITAWETRLGLHPLQGSDKAIAWASRCRHQVLTGAYQALVMDGVLDEDQWTATVEDPARMIDRASWWIDQRDAEPDEIAKLVAAAQDDTAAVSTENPL